MIHAVNLKDQLNLNLDDERADIQLVDQLEILADTFYIKVNLISNPGLDNQVQVFVFSASFCSDVCHWIDFLRPFFHVFLLSWLDLKETLRT